MAERLVVVGGDAAGMSAASQARRRRDADDLEIIAFERGTETSYSACGIPYWIGGMVEERARLVVRTPQQFRQRQRIDARVGHEVVHIDLARGRVRVRDLGAGREHDEPYDQLLLATGAVPRQPDLPGADGPGVYGIQTLDDGQAVLDHLMTRRPSAAVIVGAGYIGLEMAEALVRRGLDVHVVDRKASPMSSMDVDMGAGIAGAMRGLGIKLDLETQVDGIERDDDGRIRAVATDAGEVAADLVVLGTGTRPNGDLAAEAGVPVGRTGGIVVDPRQRTGVEGVWAAGDCAETFHRVSQRPVSIALGTIANKQGRVAGINLGGDYATFPGVLGTAVTKICGLEVAHTGLGETAATAAGFVPVCETIESTTRAGYYPDAKQIRIKVIAEKGSGRLLGAQIVGEEGAAKRIDVFATALWNSMTVEDLLNVDLSYAPPFSPVWDPVLIAARKGWQAVEADR